MGFVLVVTIVLATGQTATVYSQTFPTLEICNLLMVNALQIMHPMATVKSWSMACKTADEIKKQK